MNSRADSIRAFISDKGCFSGPQTQATSFFAKASASDAVFQTAMSGNGVSKRVKMCRSSFSDVKMA
jgi:hypothetical protein